ncbi:MAG: hypothetical protein R3C42_04835 [Parvularculaceae bacterium]
MPELNDQAARIRPELCDGVNRDGRSRRRCGTQYKERKGAAAKAEARR